MSRFSLSWILSARKSLRATLALTCLTICAFAQQPGLNVNVLPAYPGGTLQNPPPSNGAGTFIPQPVTITDFLRGDGAQQRQIEPNVASSSYNPDHIIAVYGDYRTVSLPEPTTGEVTSTGWMGISRSYDRGHTWFGALIPGFPQDTSNVGLSSPLHGLSAGSDAVVATTPGGHFYIGGLFFTPGGISNVAVVHYRDVTDTEGGDTIRYQGAVIVDKGSQADTGNFIDKPGIGADVARGTTNPTVCGPVYMAYTIFNGGTTGNLFTSKVGFTRSKQGKCGTGWDSPQYLNKNYKQNQGAAVAVDPVNGNVYVVWRHIFVPGGDGFPDSILMVVSSDGGATFSSPVPITPANWFPFDQPGLDATNGTAGLAFRTNAFPTIAVDGNRNVYVATQEKISFGSNGYYEPRILIRTLKASSNDLSASNWSVGYISGASGSAQQVMPQLTFGAGILRALWYDFRDQGQSSTRVAGGWYIAGIERQVKTYVAQVDVTNSANFDGNGNPEFGSPAVVTRYMLDAGTNPPTTAVVPGTNIPAVSRPNLPMYVNGTTPFHGDYIALVAAAPFVRNTDPKATSAFRWATKPGDFAAASSYSAWTDSRDVIFPSNPYPGGTPDMNYLFGWTQYAPPGTGNSCMNPGSRDANVYFSEIKPGVIAGSPSPNKQLVTSAGKAIERAFAVYVENPNSSEKFFRLTFVPGSGPAVSGSFVQGGELPGGTATTSVDVDLLSLSSATATLFAYCGTCSAAAPFAPFTVTVQEISRIGGTPNGGAQAQVAFDSDPSAPLVNNIDAELHDVTVSNPQYSNPQYANPQYANPQYANPQYANPQYANPQYANPQYANIAPVNAPPVGDFVWSVQDAGNTASAYSSLTNVSSSLSGYVYQVIISRTYNFPYSNSCESQSIPQDQIISVIPNYANPQYANPQYANPQYANPQYANATFATVPPGAGTVTAAATVQGSSTTSGTDDGTIKAPLQPATVYVILRVYRTGTNDTTPLNPTEVQNFFSNISQTVYPQAAPTSATQGTTTLSLASSANPAVPGQSVTFTATVNVKTNPANAGSVTGTVTFFDGNTQLGSGAVGANNQATFSTSTLTMGLHTIVAKYSGDTNFLASSTTLGQTVALASTTTTIASSENPSVYGDSVTFTATIAPASTAFPPTGTVTFYDGTGAIGFTTTFVQSGANYLATFATAALGGGTHSITATYSGDSHFTGSTSIMISQVVNPISTTVTLTSSLNPSTFGQQVTFTAQVNPGSAAGGVPAGSATFYDGATSLGTVNLQPVPNQPYGSASLSISTLSIGSHSITAKYNPQNSNFSSATSAVLTQVVNPTPAFTTFSSGSMALNGNASIANGVLTVSPENTGQRGSAWFNYLQPVKNGFTTTFTYKISDPQNVGSSYPADGITFVVQNATDRLATPQAAATPGGLQALGGGGGSIGYGPNCIVFPCSNVGTINNSLVIEFDTFNNSTAIGDPNWNHVAVQACGAGLENSNAHLGSNTSGWPDCHLAINALDPLVTPLTGQHSVTVTYDATNSVLTVTLDAVTVITLSNFNLATWVNFAGSNTDSAYVGFTSATGALEEQTDVLNWTFTPHY